MQSQSELVELGLRYSSATGISATAIPQLHIARSAVTAERVHSLYRPSLCFIVQGAKEVTIAGQIYRYAVSQYLVSTVDLPVTGEVVEATSKKPYLCFVIGIEPSVVYDLLKDSSEPVGARTRASRPGIFVGQNDPQLCDAVLRLVRCLEHTGDCAVLAPAIVREVVYRLLQGTFGDVVRELGVVGSQTQRISKAIEHIKSSFTSPLKIDDLAKLAGMSTSSFHQHFKKVTTLSPLQYQKQLRLQEARRLLVASGSSAADVAFRVGYESPSQFSREYARLFGRSPRSDLKQLLADFMQDARP